VRFYEHPHAPRCRYLVEPGSALVVEARHNQQHQVGPVGSSLDNLVLGGNKVFAQNRDVHGIAHLLQVLE
jgi:hypothetical protein